jgi:pyruvate/2-oxoglutarate dehydrogenase complex dihydrolipoamide dehydrogenase (E3) component
MSHLTGGAGAAERESSEMEGAQAGARRGGGRYNVVVIGAGTAGLVTAAGTVGLGGRAALIEAHKMGGDCLNFGCVPSKALISSAKLIDRIRRSEEMGLSSMEPRFRFEDVFARMRARRAKIEPHDSKERFEGLGVDVYLGRARFVSPHEVEIDDGTRLRARNFVIATGTKALVLPIPGLDSVPYYTNETVFDEMAKKPESILILGGGPIGCEFAQVMRRLGVAVKLVELLPRLLPRDDAEASALVRRRFEEEGIEVHAGTKATRFGRRNGRIVATVENGGAESELEAEAVLVATGRTPNVASLGLDAAGVEFDKRGVRVDETLTTSQPHIFACGDVAGPYQFTHAADYQARIVIRNVLLPWFKAKADYTWMPWVTYTDPEVAHVGLSAEDAKSKGVPHDVFRFDWDDLDRAITDGETTGFVKVVAARGKDRILGATVVGVHAGDVLHELVVAAKHGIGLSKLSGTVHAYPTFSSSVQRVADSFQKTKLTPRVARLFEWLYRWRRS